jgi:hypothetical protein
MIEIFKCNPNWQLCLYDFTLKLKIPEFLCYRSSTEPVTLIPDYFYPENTSRNPAPLIMTSGPLLYRTQHLCTQHPHYESAFKFLFLEESPLLLKSPHLNLTITSELSCEAALHGFVSEIAANAPPEKSSSSSSELAVEMEE